MRPLVAIAAAQPHVLLQLHTPPEADPPLAEIVARKHLHMMLLVTLSG